MQKINFEQTIKLIHKEINVKLVKTNKELDRFLVSAIPIIPKLGNYFFKTNDFRFWISISNNKRNRTTTRSHI